ncbi:PucR family transcriptional regulator, partial [Enterococcus faecalis]|uniref:PucR family transcriptional regulator n=1 Tax=Enterococcus faecalis TaxID=1351 RepID=UPI003CC50C4F
YTGGRGRTGTPVKELDFESSASANSALETINTYFQSNKNISLTATNMYVHRNTIIYRLKKIEEILHLTLEFPDSSLQLSLAVYLYKQKLL